MWAKWNSPPGCRADRHRFFVQVCRVAVDAGRDGPESADTVGYAVPEELPCDVHQGARVLGTRRKYAQRALPRRPRHGGPTRWRPDSRGVRQIECTINGIGERGGNASLEEVVVALAVRKDSSGYDGHSMQELFPTSACSPRSRERR